MFSFTFREGTSKEDMQHEGEAITTSTTSTHLAGEKEEELYQKTLQSLLTPRDVVTTHCLLCEKERTKEEQEKVVSFTLPSCVLAAEVREHPIPTKGEGNFVAFRGFCSSCEAILKRFD